MTRNRTSHSPPKQNTPNQIAESATKRGLRKTFHEINRIHGSVYLFISFVALILSQFPPVYEWFYGSKLDISVERSLSLSPDLPYGFSLSKIYTVTNLGEKLGRVNSIDLIMAKNEKDIIQRMKACRYRLRDLGPFVYPRMAEFSPIILRSEDNWSHRTSFSGSVSMHDMDIVRETIRQIEDEEAEWRENLRDSGKTQEEIDDMSFPIPEDLQEQLREYVRGKLAWLLEGTYTIYEISMTNEGPIILSYEIEVKKHHIYRFAQMVNDIVSYLESDGITFRKNTTLEFELKTAPAAIPDSLMNDLDKFPPTRNGSTSTTGC